MHHPCQHSYLVTQFGPGSGHFVEPGTSWVVLFEEVLVDEEEFHFYDLKGEGLKGRGGEGLKGRIYILDKLDSGNVGVGL